MDIDATARREDGVTFVTATLRNDHATTREVRVETPRAPVFPPRRQGVPEAGWDETGVTLRLPPGAIRGVGFATTAPPADPPVTVAENRRVDSPSLPTTAASVVGTLGDPRPPADALPTSTDRASGDAPRGAAADEAGGREDGGPNDDAGPPAPVREWFDAVAARADRLAELDDAASLGATADALDETGGLAGAEAAADALRRDATALRETATRAETLADRAAAAADLPRESLAVFA